MDIVFTTVFDFFYNILPALYVSFDSILIYTRTNTYMLNIVITIAKIIVTFAFASYLIYMYHYQNYKHFTLNTLAGIIMTIITLIILIVTLKIYINIYKEKKALNKLNSD